MLQGSQNQLKEVWEEGDGLDPEDFDPKTFFKLHGKTWTWLEGGFPFIQSYTTCTVLYGICSSFLNNEDTNGDGYFDDQELEALFTKEVKPRHQDIWNVSENDLCTDGWSLWF